MPPNLPTIASKNTFAILKIPCLFIPVLIVHACRHRGGSNCRNVCLHVENRNLQCRRVQDEGFDVPL